MSADDAAPSARSFSPLRYLLAFIWTITLYLYIFWPYFVGDSHAHRPFLFLPAGVYADLEDHSARGIPSHTTSLMYFGIGIILLYLAYRTLNLKPAGLTFQRPTNFRGLAAIFFAVFACFGTLAPGILMERYALPPHLTNTVYEGWRTVQHSADGALLLYTWCALTLTGLFLTVYLENLLLNLQLPLWAVLTIPCVLGALPWLRYDSFSRFFGIFWTVAIVLIYLATRTGWGLVLGNTIYVMFLSGMTYAHAIHDESLLYALSLSPSWFSRQCSFHSLWVVEESIDSTGWNSIKPIQTHMDSTRVITNTRKGLRASPSCERP